MEKLAVRLVWLLTSLPSPLSGQLSLERHHWDASFLGDTSLGVLPNGQEAQPKPTEHRPGAHFLMGVFEGRATLAHKHVCTLPPCQSAPAVQFVSHGR